MDSKLNQRKMIHDYNAKYRPKFNQSLFIRKDDDIIDAIKNVILSCERDSTFTIKVLGFEVIDNYDEIMHILWQYEDSIINKNKNKKVEETTEEGVVVPEELPTPKPTVRRKSSSTAKKRDNPYEYIDLKESDIKLLKVTYFIQIVEKKDGLVNDTLTVYIATPRIINKFYFRINGNIKSAMYQIVDASTYNNSAALNSKKQTVTLKTIFMPVRTYRYTAMLKNLDGEQIECTYFLGNMFKKSVLMMKYIFAKMGFYKTISFFQIPELWLMRIGDIDSISMNTHFIFEARKDIAIVVPKYIYLNSQIAQSLVYTIHAVVTHMKDVEYSGFFSTDTWAKSLGAEYVSKAIDTTYEKGLSILDSLEFIYDIGTRTELKLPEEDKSDIYRVLRWVMYEFNALREKDNLDVSTKKIQYAKYIAGLYASKLANGIYRISDKGDKADLTTIRQALQVAPMYLLNAISSRCQLVNYNDCINDLDVITQLKFSYKGEGGVGEKSNAIPSGYRTIHPSHLGKVDLDSSSPSDPGVSGTICPLANIYNGYFSEFSEPDKWREGATKIVEQYRSMSNKIEIARLVKNEKLSKQTNNNDVLIQCASINKTLLDICLDADTNDIIHGFDLFGDGLMYFSYED